MSKPDRNTVPEFCTRYDWLRLFGMDVTDYYMNFTGPSLRFDLGHREEMFAFVDQFVSAFDRARAILDRAFSDSRRLAVMLEYHGSGSILADFDFLRKTRECIRRIGHPHEYYHAWAPDQTVEDIAEFGPDAYTRVLFTIERRHLHRVYWGTLAKKIGIQPHIPGWMYIADKQLRIVAKPYTDEGMDLAGPNRELLRSLYDEFKAWVHVDDGRFGLENEFAAG